jgi:ankyrin repeat protein
MMIPGITGSRFGMCSMLVFCAMTRFAEPAAAQVLAVPLPGEVQDSPVAQAAREGDLPAVRALLQRGLDVNEPGIDGTPALHWAVRVNNQEMVKLLLDAGADVNAVNRYGQAPVHVAIEYHHAGMLRSLIEAGADPEVADGAGERPLHLATRPGDAASRCRYQRPEPAGRSAQECSAQ